MTDNSKILASIEKCDDPKMLWTWIENAEKKKDAVIAEAALRRLVSLVPWARKGTVEYDFWQSIHALEFVLSKENRKTTRLSRLRQKLSRVELVQTLRDLALKKKPSAGFAMLMKRGMQDLTAEAVILRHPASFDEVARSAARERLLAAGVSVDDVLKPKR
jgi:hypothetical protein